MYVVLVGCNSIPGMQGEGVLKHGSAEIMVVKKLHISFKITVLLAKFGTIIAEHFLF